MYLENPALIRRVILQDSSLYTVADAFTPRPMVLVVADRVRTGCAEGKMSDRTRELQRELDELQARIAALEAALEEKPDYGLGEGDPAVTRWELNRAVLERLRERAASLNRARSRMNHGTYGVCAQCGRPIHPDRLAVLPDTKLCIRCARAGEN